MTEQILKTDAVLTAAPGAAGGLIEPLLAQAAGEGCEPVSITLDYGPKAAADAAVVVEALVERATRTLVFAVGRILNSDGAVLVTASAVFRRPSPAAQAV